MMLVVLMLRKKLCLQAKQENFQNLQYRDYTICVNGFWRENFPEKNFERVAREVIRGETRESRLADSIAVIQGWRDRELTPGKKSSERKRGNQIWAVWGTVEVKREGLLWLPMYPSWPGTCYWETKLRKMSQVLDSVYCVQLSILH